MDTATKGGLAERISEIEEAYEFMLAYAAQGNQRGMEDDHVRDYLTHADAALDGIGAAALAAAVATAADPAVFCPFVATLDEDAQGPGRDEARAGTMRYRV